ncbi:AmpG family muropeptide MFS transporter [Alkalimarinus alittae]|uniref:AmpG family muropeptide MFS transporter n=1 Tax=Alkalimarinus alittae TaxID=2961619 RepID=A0ABY6N5S0_9ALTE|nr:AmpG family muropeptide MFS transporter [Alkalimarinus alittae]UZE97424.1 AmpG family muropeptide MFS transporter [Alkalimarinus alittae]
MPHKETISEALFNKRMLICVFTGFTSGLPLYFVYTLIPAWLRSESVSLKEIGLFALIGLPYTWKFIWAPMMDRYVPPFLGRRRGWMLITQVFLLFSMAMVGFFNPLDSLWTIAYLAAAIAFFSASQDIVLDAYRREILPDQELGLGNSIHVNAYRISGLIPGSLALILADHVDWVWVYIIVALFMAAGIAMTLAVKEPDGISRPPLSLKEAVIEPFNEFFNRLGRFPAIEILAFIFLYKLGDSMATALSTPFYLDLGFSLTEIGLIAKHAALWPAIIGGLLGGLLMVRIGINRSLWLFGLVQIVTILGFAILAEIGHNLWALGFVLAFEYLGVGLGTAAFVAFIARTTNKNYTATQLALFTAIAALPRTFANALTGYLVEGADPEQNAFAFQLMNWTGYPADGLGWTNFFLLCTACAVPGMLLLFRVAPWGKDDQHYVDKYRVS